MIPICPFYFTFGMDSPGWRRVLRACVLFPSFYLDRQVVAQAFCHNPSLSFMISAVLLSQTIVHVRFADEQCVTMNQVCSYISNVSSTLAVSYS